MADRGRRQPKACSRLSAAVAAARSTKLLAAMLTCLALAPGVAAAKPLFGVVPQDGGLPTAKDLDLMPRAGIGGLRLMANWSTVEAEPGVYDWSGLDAVVRETTKRKLEPFLFFYGTPAWAARQDRHRCEGGGCAAIPPSSDATREAFAAFAAAAVERYGTGGEFWEPKVPSEAAGACPLPLSCPAAPGEPPCECTKPRPVTEWQVWNEQNSSKYFAPKVRVRRYARLLKTTAAAIRAEDGAAEIVLGGMWGPSSARRVLVPVKPYLERLYRVDGIRKSFDSIAIHPYGSTVNRALEQVKIARTAVRRHGDREAGTWISEIGWAAKGPRGNPYVKGERGQARLLERTLSTLKHRAGRYRLRGVFWYSWRDKAGGNAICDWCGHSGLRNKGGEAKPAWRAFARVAR